jgi:hypothetical protein
MKPTVKSSGSEICEARRALDSLGHERPKRAALPERRESETCCEAPGRVSARRSKAGYAEQTNDSEGQNPVDRIRPPGGIAARVPR